MLLIDVCQPVPAIYQKQIDHECDAFEDGGPPPTHWMPLPEVPDDSRKETEK